MVLIFAQFQFRAPTGLIYVYSRRKLPLELAWRLQFGGHIHKMEIFLAECQMQPERIQTEIAQDEDGDEAIFLFLTINLCPYEQIMGSLRFKITEMTR